MRKMRGALGFFTTTSDHLRYLLPFVGYAAYSPMVVWVSHMCKDALYKHKVQGEAM